MDVRFLTVYFKRLMERLLMCLHYKHLCKSSGFRNASSIIRLKTELYPLPSALTFPAVSGESRIATTCFFRSLRCSFAIRANSFSCSLVRGGQSSSYTMGIFAACLISSICSLEGFSLPYKTDVIIAIEPPFCFSSESCGYNPCLISSLSVNNKQHFIYFSYCDKTIFRTAVVYIEKFNTLGIIENEFCGLK